MGMYTQHGNVHTTWERTLWPLAIDGMKQAYVMEQEHAHLASLHGIQAEQYKYTQCVFCQVVSTCYCRYGRIL